MRGRKADPQAVSLIMVYTLSKALAISPLEVYKMPISLAKDLLTVHGITGEVILCRKKWIRPSIH